MLTCCNMNFSYRYKVMRNCWEFNPQDRPQFSDLVKTIMEMLSVLEHKMKQGQHRSNIQSTYVNVDNCTDYHYGNLDGEEEERKPLASPIQTDLWPPLTSHPTVPWPWGPDNVCSSLFCTHSPSVTPVRHVQWGS